MSKAYFREGTKHPVTRVHFFLSQGGLGDYICHMPAFEWLAEHCTNIEGMLYVNPPFDEVARYIMRKYPHWKVYNKSHLTKVVKDGDPMVDPKNYKKFINACGAHLMDLGFIYYTNQNIAMPGYARMPTIDYDGPWRWPEINPHQPYAVVACGATAKAREMPGYAVNEICDYLNQKGITPVFLGKRDFATGDVSDDYRTKWAEDADFTKGADLREKTTLLEAVQIMRGAQMVLGVDNGLLHFAGCTEVPIIFGYTVTTVEHRVIRRPKGTTINLIPDEKELACVSCQSRMRYVIHLENRKMKSHSFKWCVYDDYKCIELLFSDKCAAWKKAIDAILIARKT